MPNEHVFISYSRKDRVLMHRVRDSLLKVGIPVWTDENLEIGTTSWVRAIEKAIESAGAVVILLSPEAGASHWVRQELSYAEIHGKPIFPVLVRGEPSKNIPLGLSSVQYLDAREGFEIAFNKLVDVIHSRIITEDLTAVSEPSHKLLNPRAEGGSHVFISYVREDEIIMERVYTDLTGEGLKVWVDTKNLVAGTRHYSVALGKAIESSDCVVVILSPEAKESEGVLDELTHAHKYKKPIIPLLVRGDEITSVPFVITNVQWIDGRQNYAEGIRAKAKRKLLADLRYYIPSP